MNITNEDLYHCKQVSGFFLFRDKKVFTPQFSVVSNFEQTAWIVIAPLEGLDIGARLVLMHRRGRRARAVGFTSEKNEKLEYFFSGTIPFGKILLVPVDGHVKNPKPDYPFEDYVDLFKEGGRDQIYTTRCEESLEYLFAMLDTDNNGFLSSEEMAVFKYFLGFSSSLTEDEWSDILFGWQEDDLDHTLTEISCSFFKKFVARFCLGEFAFADENWERRPYRRRKEDYLQRVFESFGFDKDLLPSNVARYAIRIYTERNSLSKICVIPGVKVSAEKAVTSVTVASGQRSEDNAQKLILYTLYCTDWFSIALINKSEECKEVIVDCSGTVGALPATSDSLIWREMIPGRGKMVKLALWKRGFGLLNSITKTAPVQNPPRAISSCTTLASSEVPIRLSASRDRENYLKVFLNVFYSLGNGILSPVCFL